MITTVLIVAAAVCAVLALAGVPAKVNWTALGLLLLCVALLLGSLT